MILVVSFPDNAHVEAVREHLRAPHAVVDVASFPVASSLSVAHDAAGTSMAWRLPDGQVVDLADVGAVWYRRLRPLGLAEDLDETSRLFAWSESTEALTGTWYALDAFWMNHPLADDAAQRKVLQLRLAVEVGLEIPDTLVTNDPEAARAFVERVGPGRVIRKAFRNIPEAPRSTAVVHASDLDRLELVRYAPVIFQGFVAAALDLRVTVVDGECFTAQIRSDADHQVDYRLGLGTAEVTAHQLPTELEDRLRELMRRLGVSYGAIDLRLTPQGQYVFLEINPGGEYLFASSRTGQPVPEAIAAALTRRDAEVRAGRGGSTATGGASASDLRERYFNAATGGHVLGLDGDRLGGQGVSGRDLAGAVPVQVGPQGVAGPGLQQVHRHGQRHLELVGAAVLAGHGQRDPAEVERSDVHHPDVLQDHAQDGTLDRRPPDSLGRWSCCV